MSLAKERKNVAQAACELEISGSLLRTWIAAAETAEARGKGLAGALEEKQEMERLRKRLAEAEEELEIIKNNQRRARLPWSTRNSTHSIFLLPEKRGRLLIGELFPLKNVVQGDLRA